MLLGQFPGLPTIHPELSQPFLAKIMVRKDSSTLARKSGCMKLARRIVTYWPGAAASTKGVTSVSAATKAFTSVPALIMAWLPRITM